MKRTTSRTSYISLVSWAGVGMSVAGVRQVRLAPTHPQAASTRVSCHQRVLCSIMFPKVYDRLSRHALLATLVLRVAGTHQCGVGHVAVTRERLHMLVSGAVVDRKILFDMHSPRVMRTPLLQTNSTSISKKQRWVLMRVRERQWLSRHSRRHQKTRPWRTCNTTNDQRTCPVQDTDRMRLDKRMTRI